MQIAQAVHKALWGQLKMGPDHASEIIRQAVESVFAGTVSKERPTIEFYDDKRVITINGVAFTYAFFAYLAEGAQPVCDKMPAGNQLHDGRIFRLVKLDLGEGKLGFSVESGDEVLAKFRDDELIDELKRRGNKPIRWYRSEEIEHDKLTDNNGNVRELVPTSVRTTWFIDISAAVADKEACEVVEMIHNAIDKAHALVQSRTPK
jgi:hypothetical protein